MEYTKKLCDAIFQHFKNKKDKTYELIGEDKKDYYSAEFKAVILVIPGYLRIVRNQRYLKRNLDYLASLPVDLYFQMSRSTVNLDIIYGQYSDRK